jgi:hypothetical protein
MKMFSVESSNIKSIGYNIDKRELHVVFLQSNAQYKYTEVPKDVFTDLLLADSHGKYLNKHVKGTYNYEKVDS